MGNRVTQERVKEIFKEVVRKGQMPSASQIETALGIQYKSNTVYKYLQAIKMRAYRHFIKWEEKEFGFDEENELDANKIKEHFEKISEEHKTLEEQNKLLAHELRNSEKDALKLKEKNINLENNLHELTKKHQALSAEAYFLEKLCQEIKEERAMMAQAIAKEKHQQIEALQQELKSIYKEHVETIKKMGYEGDDAVIREKVKVINLEDKVALLTQTVSTLEQNLKKEQEACALLSNRINKQQILIDKTIHCEPLKGESDG